MGELRLHFTADDLARTRVLTGPHPMWELVLSIAVMQARRVPAAYMPWRTWATGRLNRRPDRAGAALLAALVPPKGGFPDFLTPHPAAEGFAPILDAVLSSPATRIHADLSRCDAATRPPPELRRLAGGDRRSLHALGHAATWYHHAALQPLWPSIDRAVRADRDLRVHDLATHGLDHMLAHLPPCITWTPPTLRAHYPRSRDIHLAGRGLTLIPSYFCWGTPVALIDIDLPPVLVYPLGAPPAEADAPDGPSLRALSRLIGATRAQVLRSLDIPRTTTDLARHLQISPATASKHATALRAAGLITSMRRGNTVLHTMAPLGASLLNQTPPGPGPRSIAG